jgi:hypothetical protein
MRVLCPTSHIYSQEQLIHRLPNIRCKLVVTSDTSTEASCIQTAQPGLKLYVILQSPSHCMPFIQCYVLCGAPLCQFCS